MCNITNETVFKNFGNRTSVINFAHRISLARSQIFTLSSAYLHLDILITDYNFFYFYYYYYFNII